MIVPVILVLASAEAPPPPRPSAEVPSEWVDREGEWYAPGDLDERLEKDARTAWKGPYHAAEVRWVMHGFFGGPIDGIGTELVARLDVAEVLGLQLGVYLPGPGFDFGFNLFGNMRYELARSSKAGVSFGLLLPELTLRGVYLTNPDELVVGVGTQLVGFRLAIADMVHISLRGGAPSFWLSIPQLGVVWSGSGSLDVGFQF